MRGRLRRRQYPVAWAGKTLLVSGAVTPTVLGSAVIGIITFWALPTGAALSQRHVLLLNLIAVAIFAAIAIPLAVVSGYLWLTDPTAERGPGMTGQELPQDDQFDALFGCAATVEAPGRRDH